VGDGVAPTRSGTREAVPSGAFGVVREVAVGLYRCLVLTALAVAVPAFAVVGWLLGSHVTRSWSAHHFAAPFAVRAVAALGEWALAAWWVTLAVALVLVLFGRPLCDTVRRLAGQWLGLAIESPYRPVPAPVRMATGYWWNGFEYHRSEAEARRAGWVDARRTDPQFWRDALWLFLASVTAAPVAALPLLALAVAVYAVLTPNLAPWTVVLAAAALAGAPFAWRILARSAPGLLGPSAGQRLGWRVGELEAIRADLTQTQVAELERIERGLHDGTQARMVALGMSLGAAERLIDSDPEAAKRILRDARNSSAEALAELRRLVRGINPPVLVERGLVDAVRALALDASLEVVVESSVPSRPERPIESAMYFAVAELMANAAKHARATRVTVALGYEAGELSALVSDDGIGGATVREGSGLSGLCRRMAAFGGGLEIESPAGGPTRVRAWVPCVLS
jgi:signal transduction histidine kinase